jgi:hypothetical protein
MKCLALLRVRNDGLRIQHRGVLITSLQLLVAGFSCVSVSLLSCEMPVINDLNRPCCQQYTVAFDFISSLWICYVLYCFTVTFWLIDLYFQLLINRISFYHCHQKWTRECLGHISNNTNIFRRLLETFMNLKRPSTWWWSKKCFILYHIFRNKFTFWCVLHRSWRYMKMI